MFLLARIKLYAIGAVAFVTMLLGIWLNGRRAGAAAAKAAANEARWDDLAKAKKVEGEINALGDDALRERASRWVRRD
jgi:hypothetical protein